MSKPYTEKDLSDIFDSDLNWRRKELSDLKAAIRAADTAAKPVLLRSLISMSYAHWEGFVRTCANRYFEYLTLRKKPNIILDVPNIRSRLNPQKGFSHVQVSLKRPAVSR